LDLAATLGIQVRLLPRACPELNAMDHLFRFVKTRAVADQPTRSIDALSRRERLAEAGALSDNLWLYP